MSQTNGRRALLNEYMHVGYILLLCWLDDIVYLAMKLVKSRLQYTDNSSVLQMMLRITFMNG